MIPSPSLSPSPAQPAAPPPTTADAGATAAGFAEALAGAVAGPAGSAGLPGQKAKPIAAAVTAAPASTAPPGSAATAGISAAGISTEIKTTRQPQGAPTAAQPGPNAAKAPPSPVKAAPGASAGTAPAPPAGKAEPRDSLTQGAADAEMTETKDHPALAKDKPARTVSTAGEPGIDLTDLAGLQPAATAPIAETPRPAPRSASETHGHAQPSGPSASGVTSSNAAMPAAATGMQGQIANAAGQNVATPPPMSAPKTAGATAAGPVAEAAQAAPQAGSQTAPHTAPADAATPAAAPGDAMPAARPAASPAPSAHLHQPPATAAAEQVAAQVTRHASAGGGHFEIRLDPPDLGRVEVRLELGQSGSVQAVISADRPETVELLQRDSRLLERALQDAGLKADSGSLSFGLRQERREEGRTGREQREARRPDLAAIERAETISAPPRGRGLWWRGGIDIQV